MTADIILLICGLALVVLGADWLVDGASAIARRLGVSEFVIGLTIVGFGTSCPELVVSTTGAIEGIPDIAVGNVIGSNIFNTLFILGLTALVMPISITAKNRRLDIPLALGVTLLLVVTKSGDTLSRGWGIIFLILFALYMYLCFKTDEGSAGSGEDDNRGRSMPIAAIMVAAGLAGLVFGGKLFVDHSVNFAKLMGVSDKFISITLLAGGTSLPELVTSLIAAAKKKGQLALGNVIGSNIFNILLILGVSSCILPLSLANINLVDMGVLMLSIVTVYAASWSFDRDKLDRKEGLLLLAVFLAYYVWLFIKD